MKKFALFSVNELKDIVEFAVALREIGWEIIATDNCLNALKKSGIPAISVADFAGVSEKFKFPATLHPKFEAALTDDDYFQRIELVYDITYGAQDGFDVGGNTLLALAVKGNRLPVASYEMMKSAVNYLHKAKEIPDEFRKKIISDVIVKITDYYIETAKRVSCGGTEYIKAKSCYGLLNGENPYQNASLLTFAAEDKLSLSAFKLISANKPCFTNMADLDCVTETITRLASSFNINYKKQPFIAVAAKHGNACGIGMDWESKGASIEKALWGNPLAIWGGEVILNFKLEKEEAELLTASDIRKKMLGAGGWMLDVIACAELSDEARVILGLRKNTKLFENSALCSPWIRKDASYRFVRGGLLRQAPADYCLDFSRLDWNIDTDCSDRREDLIIAWAAAFTSFHGGNEVAIAKGQKLLACAGGPSTVDAAKTAVSRAVDIHGNIRDSVFCADAFFPFTDAPLILVAAGVVCGVVPAGGKKYSEVKEYFTKNKIPVGFIPEQFRGFCRH